MTIVATLRSYDHTIVAVIFDSTAIEEIYDSIYACTEINSNYRDMESEVQKTWMFPWLLLSASAEDLILPKLLERVVRIGKLDILFRFIQENNI